MFNVGLGQNEPGILLNIYNLPADYPGYTSRKSSLPT